MHAEYSMTKEDFMNAYRYAKKLLEKSQSERAKETQFQTNHILHLYAAIQVFLKKYKEALNTLNKLRAISAPSVSKQAEIFEQSYGNELDIYIITGAFEKGIAIDEVKSGLERYGKNLRMTGKITFYFNFAYLYFGVGDYDKAIEWVNKILNETDIKAREDMQAVTRILNLIIHFELDNIDLLEYASRSTYRFLAQRDRLYKIETAVLHFFKNKLPKINITVKKELLAGFKELKDEIIEISKDPLEKIVITEYFDFISWLESKIENRAFGEIVREKS